MPHKSKQSKCRTPSIYKNVTLIDAKKPLIFDVNRDMMRRGVPMSFSGCAGVLGIQETGHFEGSSRKGFYRARVYRNTVHVQVSCGDTTVLRYKTNDGVRMIETLNDLKAIPQDRESFEIRLDPPSEKDSLAYRAELRLKRKAKLARGEKAKKHKYPSSRRKHPSPKDAFGIRAHAPRNDSW